MAFATLQADFREFGGLQRKIDRLLGLFGDELRQGIGAILESGARRRISETKLAPDGTPWPEWSRNYAEDRPQGKSLLQGEGHLLDSIQFETTEESVTVFAPLVYAATHQFGDDRLITIGAHSRRITQAFGRRLKFPVFQRVGERKQQRHIPARPFLGMGPDEIEEIGRLVDGLVDEAFE